MICARYYIREGAKPSREIFSFDPSTCTRISSSPLLPDPYEVSVPFLNSATNLLFPSNGLSFSNSPISYSTPSWRDSLRSATCTSRNPRFPVPARDCLRRWMCPRTYRFYPISRLLIRLTTVSLWYPSTMESASLMLRITSTVIRPLSPSFVAVRNCLTAPGDRGTL